MYGSSLGEKCRGVMYGSGVGAEESVVDESCW